MKKFKEFQLDESFNKDHVAHNLVKKMKGLGRVKYHKDGSATLHTKSSKDYSDYPGHERGVPSTSMADHALKTMSNHDVYHNWSHKDLKNHKQNGNHAEHGKFHVHVQGDNKKGHTVTVKSGHTRGAVKV